MDSAIKRRFGILLVLLLGTIAIWLFRQFRPIPTALQGQKTVEDRLKQYGPQAESRLRPAFDAANVSYPPGSATLLIFKEEKRLDLYATGKNKTPRLIKSYPILAASGRTGPKLAEGDHQVPEGLYRIESLNPNSLYHLSLRVNYPNEEDKARAREDGRDKKNLGGDIMIHGNEVSIGCVAIGDPAIEEIFTVAARTGIRNLNVIISPCDFRSGATTDIPAEAPAWTADRHEKIRSALQNLKD